VYQRLDR